MDLVETFRIWLDHVDNTQSEQHNVMQIHHIERVLQTQINVLQDNMNYELQQYWNWDICSPNNDIIRTPFPPLHFDLGSVTSSTSSAQSKAILEVIVADLHDVIIQSSHKYFSSLGLPVILRQDPIQRVILDSLRCDESENVSVSNFIIFGGYGSGKTQSALQKQLFEAFPEQMNDISLQAIHEVCHIDLSPTDISWELEQKANTENIGKVWISTSPLSFSSGTLQLVCCAAYPRNQPEDKHVCKMFHQALHLITKTVISQNENLNTHSTPSCFTKREKIEEKEETHKENISYSQKIRIITHAIGSFIGHPNPSDFSLGLAYGFDNFIKDIS
jgi:hypothetical protein